MAVTQTEFSVRDVRQIVWAPHLTHRPDQVRYHAAADAIYVKLRTDAHNWIAVREEFLRECGIDTARLRGVAIACHAEYGYSRLWTERSTYSAMVARLHGFVDGWYILAERIFGAMGTRSVYRDPALQPDYHTLRNCLMDAASCFDHVGEESYVLACMIAFHETCDRLSPAAFVRAASAGVQVANPRRKYHYA